MQTHGLHSTMRVLSFLIVCVIFTTSHASSVEEIVDFIHLIRAKSGSGKAAGVSCSSWRLAVETNNIQDWRTVPAECENYIGHYMLGDLYGKDFEIVADEAAKYAKGVVRERDGKAIWVFDVDETTLSNLPYYAKHGFGAEPYNLTLFNKWVDAGKAPALPYSLKLYKKLLELGVKIVFLTGRSESQRNTTAMNLKAVGYRTWEALILKGPSYQGVSAVVYKSTERKKLEGQGYIIIGNMGDQWSDILGTNTGKRTFKVPDPMAEPYNATMFKEWVDIAKAPALPPSLKLYKKLQKRGIRIVFLTGRLVSQRNSTTKNLKEVGYHTWKALILKGPYYQGVTSTVYKSTERKKLKGEG